MLKRSIAAVTVVEQAEQVMPPTEKVDEVGYERGGGREVALEEEEADDDDDDDADDDTETWVLMAPPLL